ncbi:hypothetical protein AK812_SmicGene27210 [Symbiodinium microadriaticum]|uniref:Uncharacterized protein n=1 Tax=Symbiodinium microadriaticum TaxID=2951 RepID=A0A1Q9D7G9_SYMMI|nr:hypothetical protein AK812_SmicGene27210 [Symbiodinium microadriaticum]
MAITAMSMTGARELGAQQQGVFGPLRCYIQNSSRREHLTVEGRLDVAALALALKLLQPAKSQVRGPRSFGPGERTSLLTLERQDARLQQPTDYA